MNVFTSSSLPSLGFTKALGEALAASVCVCVGGTLGVIRTGTLGFSDGCLLWPCLVDRQPRSYEVYFFLSFLVKAAGGEFPFSVCFDSAVFFKRGRKASITFSVL